jgi:hypothetical protein
VKLSVESIERSIIQFENCCFTFEKISSKKILPIITLYKDRREGRKKFNFSFLYKKICNKNKESFSFFSHLAGTYEKRKIRKKNFVENMKKRISSQIILTAFHSSQNVIKDEVTRIIPAMSKRKY